MGRAPCCDKANVKKGPWSAEEDDKLKSYIEKNGTGGNWIALPQKIGLKRCGKSCRLRWLNYLRPNIKHGGFSQEEDNIICSLYVSIGSRWSIIASQLPGRTDNDIKNYWNTRLKKRLLSNQLQKELQTKNSVKGWDGKMFMKQEEIKQTSFPNSLFGINLGADGNHITPYCPDCPDTSTSSLVNYTLPPFASSSSSSSSIDNILGFQTMQTRNSQEIAYNGEFLYGMDEERSLLESVTCDASNNEPSWGYLSSMMALSTPFSSSEQYYEATRSVIGLKNEGSEG